MVRVILCLSTFAGTTKTTPDIISNSKSSEEPIYLPYDTYDCRADV
jgi:hypothetical protein